MLSEAQKLPGQARDAAIDEDHEESEKVDRNGSGIKAFAKRQA